MGSFEENIDRLTVLSADLKAQITEAHGVLKDLRQERRKIEILLKEEIKDMVHNRVDEVVKEELDKIGPTIRHQTSLIYERVGDQIDKLIDLSLGKEFKVGKKHGDLRPMLAEKLREWLREIIDDEENS